MNHLAQIQAEFLKTARSWDKMSLKDQKAYLRRHPKSKRKLTGKPENKTKTVGKDKNKARARELMKKSPGRSVISINPKSSADDIEVAKYIMRHGSYGKKGHGSGRRVRTLLDALKAGVVSKVDVRSNGYFYFSTKRRSVYDPANLEYMDYSLRDLINQKRKQK